MEITKIYEIYTNNTLIIYFMNNKILKRYPHLSYYFRPRKTPEK